MKGAAMADEATQEVQETSSAETTAVESQSSEQTTQVDSDAQQTESQTSDTDNAEDASTGDKSKSEDQDFKVDSKPLSRRSAAYRIQELVRENKELKKQQGKPVEEQNEWDEEPAKDELNPEITALKAEVAEIKGMVKPVYTESAKAADSAEISELFSSNAADKTKYEGEIRRLWNLSQYKDVSALDLFNMLRGKEMEKSINAAKLEAVEEFKKAEKEAKESSGSGNSNSNRTGKTGKSVAEMTPAELEAHNQRVIAGQPV